MRINLPPKLESECSQVSVEITKNRSRKREKKTRKQNESNITCAGHSARDRRLYGRHLVRVIK